MSTTSENQSYVPQPFPQQTHVPNYAFQSSISGNKQVQLYSLYVGELKKEITEQLLWSIFLAYGQVVSIKVCRDSKTHISLGYAYVNYRTAEEAEKAIECLNFSLIDGKPCRIMWSNRDSSKRKNPIGNLIIKNIDAVIDAKSLFKAFSTFGKILACKIALNEYGKSKGICFIQYSNEEDALKAQNHSNGIIFHKKKLVVTKFISKSERKDAKPVNPNEFTNIFVKNFTRNWTDAILRKNFEIFGEITSCVVQKNEDGESMCYGFVNFAKYEDAARAVKEMNDFVVEGGNKITVCRAMKKLERQSFLKKQHENHKKEMLDQYKNMNLYVKNFDETLTDDQLRQLFQEFGKITSARVMRDELNRSKCFGFVCFSKSEDAEAAMCKMSTKVINGNPLYVSYAQPKEERAKFKEQKTFSMNFRHPTIPPQAMPFIYVPPFGFPYGPVTPFPRYPQPKLRYQNRQNNQAYNSQNYNKSGNTRPEFNNSENPQNNYSNNKQKNNSKGSNLNHGNKVNNQQAICVANNPNVDNNNNNNNKGNENKKNNKKEVEVQTKNIKNEFIIKRNDFNNKIYSTIQAFVNENNHAQRVIPQLAGVLIDYFTNNSKSYSSVEDPEIREACENAYESMFKKKSNSGI